jgi:hypothetical protein
MSSSTQPIAVAQLRSDVHARLSAAEPPPTLHANVGSPPAHLLAQMARADRIHQQIAAHGIEIGFLAVPGLPPQIELRRREGRGYSLSPAQAIELACGGAPE